MSAFDEWWDDEPENELARRAFIAGTRAENTRLIKLFQSGHTGEIGEPCNHGNYTWDKHGRVCPCGVHMVDFGD